MLPEFKLSAHSGYNMSTGLINILCNTSKILLCQPWSM